MDTFPDGGSPGDEGMGTSHGEESEDTFTGCEGISESDGEESKKDEGTSREANIGVGEEIVREKKAAELEER